MDRAFPSWIALDCSSSPPRRRVMIPARSSPSTTLLSSSPRSPARSRRRVWPPQQQHGGKPALQHPLLQQQAQPLMGGVQESPLPNTSVPATGSTLIRKNNCTDCEGLAAPVVVLLPETEQQHDVETSTYSVWTAELELERRHLLKLCQEGGTETDDVDLRYVADRIKNLPEILQPIAMSSKGQELLHQDCQLDANMTTDNNNHHNHHLSSLHQETRKRGILLRLREEQQQQHHQQQHHHHHQPQQLHNPPPLRRCSTARSTTSDTSVVYEPTILGVLCSLNMSITSRRDDSATTTISSKDNDADNSIIHCSNDSCVLPSIVVELIRAVLQIRPELVRCNQRRMGHTPLRDAVCNPTCSPIVVELLVQADRALLLSLEQQQQQKYTTTTTDDSAVLTTFQPTITTPLSSVVHWPDQDGLTPLDHLLHAVQLGPQSEGAVARLQSLVQHASPVVGAASSSDVVPKRSPLLYLLSLGTSFRVLPSMAAVLPVVSPDMLLLLSDGGCERQDSTLRLHRILDCTRLLLQWDSSFLLGKSQSTGCTPLHVAIRNYGNFAPLIRELIERDVDCRLLRHRNCFGDLPLHVACSVGVPMDIMRLVLARSLIASSSSPSPSSMSGATGGANVPLTEQPNPLVWSTNSSGYTPVDLEWIRHIEAGNGFFSHRSFYPLDARGIRRPEARCDALYGVLLRQAVDQVLTGEQPPPPSFSTTINTNEGTTTIANIATGIAETQTDNSARTVVCDTNDGPVGLLLHRILLVVRASFGDSFSRSPFDLSGDILHQAAALYGLPRPILELILWQHPDQIERQDHAGKLPLHYAVRLCRSNEVASVKSLQEWKQWIEQLLHVGPEACRVKDNRKRLPLHYALDYPLSREIAATTTITAPVQEVRNSVLRLLVNQFPQSVELADPVTKLFPFQLAAVNPLVSLETSYVLLRMCPGAVSHCMLRREA